MDAILPIKDYFLSMRISVFDSLPSAGIISCTFGTGTRAEDGSSGSFATSETFTDMSAKRLD